LLSALIAKVESIKIAAKVPGLPTFSPGKQQSLATTWEEHQSVKIRSIPSNGGLLNARTVFHSS